MFHSGNISLRRWAYLSEPAEPGRRLGDCLGDFQFVGHDIDNITFSYATCPLKSWTFCRSCVGAGGLFPAWHLTCMPQSQNSLGCFLNEDFREKT